MDAGALQQHLQRPFGWTGGSEQNGIDQFKGAAGLAAFTEQPATLLHEERQVRPFAEVGLDGQDSVVAAAGGPQGP